MSTGESIPDGVGPEQGPAVQPLIQSCRLGVYLMKMPSDPSCRKVSIGELPDKEGSQLVMFFGDAGECLRLMERATRALRADLKRFL